MEIPVHTPDSSGPVARSVGSSNWSSQYAPLPAFDKPVDGKPSGQSWSCIQEERFGFISFTDNTHTEMEEVFSNLLFADLESANVRKRQVVDLYGLWSSHSTDLS